MLAEHQPGKEHRKRRHQEVPGAGSRGAANLQQVKPQQVRQDRTAQHEEGEGPEQSRTRDDVVPIGKRRSERQQRKPAGDDSGCRCRSRELPFGASSLKRMVPITMEASEASVNRMPFEMLRADRQAMPDDEGDAGDAEQDAHHLSPCQRLAEEERGEHCGEDRVGAGDETAEAGGDGLQPGIAEAEIERVVGDAEKREGRDVASEEIASVSLRSADRPGMRRPASGNRAVSRISGGQSMTPILPATKESSRAGRTGR